MGSPRAAHQHGSQKEHVHHGAQGNSYLPRLSARTPTLLLVAERSGQESFHQAVRTVCCDRDKLLPPHPISVHRGGERSCGRVRPPAGVGLTPATAVCAAERDGDGRQRTTGRIRRKRRRTYLGRSIDGFGNRVWLCLGRDRGIETTLGRHVLGGLCAESIGSLPELNPCARARLAGV